MAIDNFTENNVPESPVVYGTIVDVVTQEVTVVTEGSANAPKANELTIADIFIYQPSNQ